MPEAEARLRTALAQVLDEQGQPWFSLVKAEQVYAGARLQDAPDYLLIPRDFSVMPTPALTGQVWSTPTQRGVHRPDGIVFIRGSTFPEDTALQARIEDIYPTILAHLGLPVPEGLEGHWLVEPPHEPRREPGRQGCGGQRMSEEEQRFMDSQLQQIGYF